MPNYYTQVSIELDSLTPVEHRWLDHMLSLDLDEPVDARRFSLWTGKVDAPVLLDEGWPPCDYSFSGQALWLYGDHVWMDNLIWLVHAFYRLFRPDEVYYIGYAETCSCPRLDAYAGGAVLVTARTVEWFDGMHLAMLAHRATLEYEHYIS